MPKINYQGNLAFIVKGHPAGFQPRYNTGALIWKKITAKLSQPQQQIFLNCTSVPEKKTIKSDPLDDSEDRQHNPEEHVSD
jgi:hypothetical protein